MHYLKTAKKTEQQHQHQQRIVKEFKQKQLSIRNQQGKHLALPKAPPTPKFTPQQNIIQNQPQLETISKKHQIKPNANRNIVTTGDINPCQPIIAPKEQVFSSTELEEDSLEGIDAINLDVFDSLEPNNIELGNSFSEEDFGFRNLQESNSAEKSKKRSHDELGGDTNNEFMTKMIRTDSHVSFAGIFDFQQEDEENTKTENGTENKKEDPLQIEAQVMPLIQKVLDDDYGWLFKDPVDPIELGIPDYFNIIKEPMDLNSIVKGLKNGKYNSITSTERDVKLVFENAIKYNGEDSDVGQMAIKYMTCFIDGCNRLK